VTWDVLWAYGRYDLGLSESEFWRLTPREFGLLADRDALHVEWHDRRSALAPFIMTALFAPKSKPKMNDFLIRSSGDLVKKESKPAEVQDKVHSTMQMLAEGRKRG
jgi:hypothetical protein